MLFHAIWPGLLVLLVSTAILRHAGDRSAARAAEELGAFVLLLGVVLVLVDRVAGQRLEAAQ